MHFSFLIYFNNIPSTCFEQSNSSKHVEEGLYQSKCVLNTVYSNCLLMMNFYCIRNMQRIDFSSSFLQSALQSLWALVCSTIVEYSQQEGFYRVPLPAARQPGGPLIRTFQLSPPRVSHIRNDASELQQRKVELWARNCREFCRKW